MQYQVTCNKCHRSFAITSDGSDRMHCNCPYCGQPLLVNLPAIAQPVMPSVQSINYDVQDKGGDNSSIKVLLCVLIVLFLGGFATFGFIYWQQ